MSEKEPDRLQSRRADTKSGARESPFEMISVPSALECVLSHAAAGSAGNAESVPLASALDRILASDVTATEPFPPFRASVMDGYAVVASDGPGTYTVSRDITAGVDLSASSDGASAAGSAAAPKPFKLSAGCVAYITTGAPVPDGADAVVQVEKTELVPNQPNLVKINGKPSVNQFIRPIGCDMKKGETILRAGERLGPAEIGVLASVGIVSVRVIRKARVAILSTGDELGMFWIAPLSTATTTTTTTSTVLCD